MAGHFGHNYLRKYYLGTYLGLIWLPLLPLIDLLMRSLLFGGFLQVPSGGRPYFLFLLVGTLGFFFFERTAYWGYRALQYNRRYFRHLPAPWLPAVTGAVVPGALMLAVYSAILAVTTAFYAITQGSFYVSLDVQSLYALLGLLLLLAFALTIGLLLAPVVRAVRDVYLFARFPLMLWYVVTPILYTAQSMPPEYREIAIYNPLTAPIELIRHGLLDMSPPEQASVIVSVAFLAVVAPLALLMFLRAERASHERL